MTRLLQSALCGLTLILSARAQLVGTVDLASPLAPALENYVTRRDLPEGCTSLGGGFADGFIGPESGEKKEITLEVIELGDTPLIPGAEFAVEIRLKNTGRTIVQIPWSNDPATATAGADRDAIEYESGEFDVSLIDGDAHQMFLKPPSTRLFSSKEVTGSEIRIAPGQWVKVRASFKLTPKYGFGEPLSAGRAKLTAEWRQARHYWRLDRIKCEVWRGTSLYYGLLDHGYYEQHSIPTEVTITTEAPLESTIKEAR